MEVSINNNEKVVGYGACGYFFINGGNFMYNILSNYFAEKCYLKHSKKIQKTKVGSKEFLYHLEAMKRYTNILESLIKVSELEIKNKRK